MRHSEVGFRTEVEEGSTIEGAERFEVEEVDLVVEEWESGCNCLCWEAIAQALLSVVVV